MAAYARSTSFGHGSFAHLTGGGAVEASSLARAVASVIWAYDGWVGVSMIAGEVMAPDRLLKQIIVTGVLVIVGLYLAANVAYLYMFPVAAMAVDGSGVAAHLMREVAGSAGSLTRLRASRAP